MGEVKMSNFKYALLGLLLVKPIDSFAVETAEECSRDAPEVCVEMAMREVEVKPGEKRDLPKIMKYSEPACDGGSAMGCVIFSAGLGESEKYDEAKKAATLGCIYGRTEKFCNWLKEVDDLTRRDLEKQAR
ncbi:MAG: hypothetical protein KA715_07570 [Xanthomonadaceae bacterium]|nr:hypothetical protein [Xanthomonadaceae bacterium]